MALPYEVIQQSLIGGRKSNQDRVGYAFANDTLLMVVADGMGGHQNGEVAAEIAVRVLIERFNREARLTLSNPGHFLRVALEAAHATIGSYTRTHNLPDYPRTTCVAPVLVAQGAHVQENTGSFPRSTLNRRRPHSRRPSDDAPRSQ